ncbi:helix-turn-helix domain-containing protein [Streptomyces sp. NPDC058372]|uniref:helix-turn-helix domain-containing protein n=1 Tax=unclassified Streptomyces TaxID=2593676 RepID=UPI00364D1482
MPGDGHAGFGRRLGETHWWKHQQGAPSRPHQPRGSPLCLRVDAGRSIAHVAAEAGISRHRLAKWYARWLAHGEDGLTDRSSPPIASPNRTSEDIADLVEALRRQTKYGPARLAAELEKLHASPWQRPPCTESLVRRGLRFRPMDHVTFRPVARWLGRRSGGSDGS